MVEREFTLKHVFEDVGKLKHKEEFKSSDEEHFGVNWRIIIKRCYEYLGMHLYIPETGRHQIHADFVMKIISKNKDITHSHSLSHVFGNTYGGKNYEGRHELIDWKTLEGEYLNNGKLEAEVHVKITEIIRLPTNASRSFVEEMNRLPDFRDSQTVQGILSVSHIADALFNPFKHSEEPFEENEELLVKESKMGFKYMVEYDDILQKSKQHSREFTLKHVFEDVGKLEDNEELDSPEEKNLGLWKINLKKKYGHLKMDLYTNVTGSQYINADFTMKIYSKNKGKSHSQSGSYGFKNKLRGWIFWGYPFFIDWKTLEDEYLNNGNLEVEVHVKITKEIRFSNDKVMRFFYYSEVLDDQNVEGILSVTDMFDTPLIVKECEEFLIKESKRGLRKKLELALNYRLEELEKMCLNQIKSKEDLRSVIPENPSEMDPKTLAEILKKSLDFN